MTKKLRNRILQAAALLTSLFVIASLLPSAALKPLTLSAAQAAPGEALTSGGPAIQAEAAVVMEVNSGAVLYAKNSTAAQPPVSLTKLLTCLLAFENGTLTDSVSCSYTSIHGIGSAVTRVGLVYEERLSLKDMLCAILVASADEASYAVAEHIGGKIGAFITMMNERAEELGCVNSNFTNALGAAAEDHYSCAYDLALIASELSKFPEFYQIAGLKWYEIPATNKNEARVIAQTHAFLRQTKKYEYAIAGKSGGSLNNAYSLCTYAEKNGMQLVAVILGSPSNDAAYDDTVSILNYAFEKYQVYDLLDAESQMSDTYNALFGSCPMFSHGTDELVYTNDNASLVLPNGADIKQVTKSVVYYDIEEYIHGENVIGAVLYQYQGQQIGKTQIIFNNPEFPMSQAEFDAVWPKFLIPPSTLASQGGSGANTEAVTPTPTATPGAGEKNDSSDASETVTVQNRKAKLFSVTLFTVLFLVSLTVIYIVLPMQRRRKNRRRARH